MYFDDLLDVNNCIDAFFEMHDRSRQLIMFGGGFALNRTLQKFENLGFKIAGICDNSVQKQGTVYSNKYTIMSLQDSIARFPGAVYIISTPVYFDEIKSQLEETVEPAQICPIDFECGHYFSGAEFKRFVLENRADFQKFYDHLADEESKRVLYAITKAHFSGDRRDYANALSTADDWYLFKSLLKPHTKSVYIDCGAYDGDTLKIFKDAAVDGYAAMYAFEPDEEILDTLRTAIECNKIANVTIIPKGAYDKDGTMSFIKGGVYSLIADSNKSVQLHTGSMTIRVCTIDRELQGAFVDIIKMDIEGAEYRALLGAAETIKKHKPRLAICLYHNIEDFLRIQALLLSLVPGYKLFLRHHSRSCTDTILYALP